MHRIRFHDLPGLTNFETVWKLQEKLQKEVILNKQNALTDNVGHLIFCEHTHTYTLGRFGKGENLLVDRLLLLESGIQFFHIDRGGDITYHGPGQIVGYPIFNLEALELGVKTYVHTLEQSVIDFLAEYGISTSRLEGATGVWVDTNTPKARKICAIGIKVNRGVTMHGFAFNINTDLSHFNKINPCGFTDKSVTSMEKELLEKQDMSGIRQQLLVHLLRNFNAELG